MTTNELRALDSAALKKELDDLLRAHFSLRMQIATQQLNNTSQLGKTRRAIARVRTIMNEKASAK
ncbi:MAG: 50S ribosomal protein L29 [Burkholderiaceae bacterium]|nr:50S ribosomal protein L29 [Burkholderiaceae bacterium]